MTADRPLTPKQEAFVRAYLTNGRNASAAYRTAYDCSRMAEPTVNRNAHGLLRHSKIAARITAAVTTAERRTEVDVATVINRLWEESEYAGEGASHSARVSALKLLGMVKGLYVNTTDHRGGVELRVKRIVVDSPGDRPAPVGTNGHAPQGAGGLL